jgi:hypothetical protein
VQGGSSDGFGVVGEGVNAAAVGEWTCVFWAYTRAFWEFCGEGGYACFDAFGLAPRRSNYADATLGFFTAYFCNSADSLGFCRSADTYAPPKTGSAQKSPQTPSGIHTAQTPRPAQKTLRRHHLTPNRLSAVCCSRLLFCWSSCQRVELTGA